MSINHQTARVNTTMGMRAKDPLCHRCRQEIPGDVLLTYDANGKPICPDCSGEPVDGSLRGGSCKDEECPCRRPDQP